MRRHATGMISRTVFNSIWRLCRWYKLFDLTVDEAKEPLNPFRDRQKGKHRSRKVNHSDTREANTPAALAVFLYDSG